MAFASLRDHARLSHCKHLNMATLVVAFPGQAFSILCPPFFSTEWRKNFQRSAGTLICKPCNRGLQVAPSNVLAGIMDPGNPLLGAFFEKV